MTDPIFHLVFLLPLITSCFAMYQEGNWSQPIPVGNNVNGSTPFACFDNDTLLVTWIESGKLYSATSLDTGQSWNEKKLIHFCNDSSLDSKNPVLVSDGNGLWVVGFSVNCDISNSYVRPHPGYNIFVSFSWDNGMTWSYGQFFGVGVSTDTSNDDELTMAYGGGTWLAMWTNIYSNTHSVLMARSTKGNSSWVSEILPISKNSTATWNARSSLYYDGEKFILALVTSPRDNITNEVYSAQSRDGILWTKPTRVTASTSKFCEHPSVASDGRGTVAVVWRWNVINSLEAAYIHFSSLETDGSWNSTPVRLDNTQSLGDYPNIITDKNNIWLVVWPHYAQYTPSSGNISFTWSTDNTNTWSPEQTVNLSAQGKVSPVTDQNGNWLIFFQSNNGIMVIRKFFRIFSEPKPEPEPEPEPEPGPEPGPIQGGFQPSLGNPYPVPYTQPYPQPVQGNTLISSNLFNNNNSNIIIKGSATVNKNLEVPPGRNLSIIGDLDVSTMGYISLSNGTTLLVSGNIVVNGNIVLNGGLLLVSGNFSSGGNICIGDAMIVVDGCINLSGNLTITKQAPSSQVVIYYKNGCRNGTFQSLNMNGLDSCIGIHTDYGSYSLTVIFFDTCAKGTDWQMLSTIIAVCCVFGFFVIFAIVIICVPSLKHIFFPYRIAPPDVSLNVPKVAE